MAVMLSVIYAKCHCCKVSQIWPFMLSVVMLNVVAPVVGHPPHHPEVQGLSPERERKRNWRESDYNFCPLADESTKKCHPALINIWSSSIPGKGAFHDSGEKKLPVNFPPKIRGYLHNCNDLYYKTFSVHNLQIFVISQSVCPCRAIPAQSIVCGKGQDPTLDWSI